MEDLLYKVMERINQMVPEISFIDIDWGQLDVNPEEGYPVTFPAVLVDVDKISWQQTGSKLQPGKHYMKVKTAIQNTKDTHFSSGTTFDALGQLAIARDVHNAVYLFQDKFTKLSRAETSIYNLPGMIKVFEVIYETEMLD